VRVKLSRWFFISTFYISLGFCSAISEDFITKKIDSILPNSSKTITFSRPGTITLLSSNNKIIQKIGPTTREKVPIGLIPIQVKNAFIVAEDRRFYEHNGVDLWGIGRALLTNFKNKGVIEGGSTITQQLARIVFLSQDKTFTRKIKEALLAYKLERELSKDQILEQYLNNVYLGSSAYGISDAAWVYFSKKPNELKLEEAALIAGLPPAPSYYSPLVNSNLALKQRSIVLESMLKEGYITKETYTKTARKPLILKTSIPKYYNSIAPFFSSWVNQRLPTILDKEQLEIGGLIIRTSLNLDWQKEAKETLLSQESKDLEGAIVSIEPSTGLIRVLIGGKNFDENQFNRATQALRSPGSTFKIFPYAAAIERGYLPDDLVIDKPTCWLEYCPKNFGDKYMGKVSISDSFKYSLNSVAVNLLDQVGFDDVLTIAKNLGVNIASDIGKYYPLAIGAYEQTLLEMTGAYAGITNKGIFIDPIPFEEIRGPDNNMIWTHSKNHKKSKKALSIKTAKYMIKMLQEVVKDGTGSAAFLKSKPVAGKTGTSEGGRDLWFIGSIPELTTGIWFGYDDNKKTKRSSADAALAWKNFMLKIEEDFNIKTFE